jgi:lipopolysaccharide/colanic/teichoic acid biosynthesis glycosyltransferase
MPLHGTKQASTENGHQGITARPASPGTVINRLTRLGDVLIALCLLAATGPLIAFAALAMKYESPGPALDTSQTRGSRSPRLTLLKLRTRALDHATPSAREATAIGWFVEYARIDELPRLINLLRGEVGLLDRRRPFIGE